MCKEDLNSASLVYQTLLRKTKLACSLQDCFVVQQYGLKVFFSAVIVIWERFDL